MNDLDPAGIGHNQAPAEVIDPMELAVSDFSDDREMAQMWLDGRKVENQGQMEAVDALSVTMREALKDLEAAKEGEYRPHKVLSDNVIAKYKPTIEDYGIIIKGLVGLVGPFKKKLADDAAEKTRLAFEAARKLEREAEAKAAVADVSDIDAQREAVVAKKEAVEAHKVAKSASKEKPKRMRSVTKHEITDHKAALHWIAVNDRDAMTAFIEGYVRQNHKGPAINGVKVWTEKEAF